jgi:hypothetical protein
MNSERFAKHTPGVIFPIGNRHPHRLIETPGSGTRIYACLVPRRQVAIGKLDPSGF